MRWYARFYLGAINDHWYRSLFPSTNSSLVCGEITPAYSILGKEEVARIAQLFPALKIILLLRNPVDRAWSQVRFDWTRGARASIGNAEEIKAFIDSRKQTLRSDYLRTLENWESCFPPEQLLVGFYDEIVGRPAQLLERVTRFLGIDPVQLEAGELERKVHASREAPMPPEIRSYLAQKYETDLLKMEKRFGAPVSEWIATLFEKGAALRGTLESAAVGAFFILESLLELAA